MSNDRTTVTKLATNGLNWISYRERMTWAFKCRRWSEHLSTTTVPQRYLDAGDINGISPQARWASEEYTAKEMIAESIPDHVFNRIKTKTTTMEVWDTIKGLYQSRSKIIDLNKRLQNAKCGEDDDIRAHINKLDDMREWLSAMGKDIDDQEFALILLGSLPTSYAPTTSPMNITADMTGIRLDITPDRVTRLATEEYDRRMIATGKFDNGPDEAFATEDQKKNRSNFECYNCHKKGHVKSKCWAKGGGKEGQRPPRNKDRINNNRNNRNSNINQNNDNAPTQPTRTQKHGLPSKKSKKHKLP